MYYVYMIRCIDDSIYTGITTNVERRMKEHATKSNKCAKYTLNHQAIKLESVWQTSNRKYASKLEFHIKKLKREQKEKLIKDNNLEILLNKIEIENYVRII